MRIPKVVAFGLLGWATAACFLLGSPSDFVGDALDVPETSLVDAFDSSTDFGVDPPPDAGSTEPQTIVTGVVSPRELLVLGDELVWVDGRAIRRCKRAGCVAAETVVDAPSDIIALRGSGTNLVWSAGPATMRKTELGADAGASSLVRDLARPATGLALESTTLFWLERGGGVRKCIVGDNCTATTATLGIVDAGPQPPLVFGNGSIYWVIRGFDVVACPNATVSSSCAPTPIVEGEASELIAMSAGISTFAWANAVGEVKMVSLVPGNPDVMVKATGLTDLKQLLVEEPFIYVATSTEVVRLSSLGTGSFPVFEHSGIATMAIAGGDLYVGETETGTIVRVPL